MASKRGPEQDFDAHAKLPKIEHDLQPGPLSQQRSSNNDFSGSVKKKLASSTRTGQACDRCKVRKIRCDARPEGCSPCAQNRTPCKTTDRITGRATTRGHTEATEAENQYLRAQIADLQAQLKDLGVEPRPTPAYNPYAQSSGSWTAQSARGDSQSWSDPHRRASASPLPGYGGPSSIEHAGPLPEFKTAASIGDNYLGVSSADSLLSHIRGTSLSIFGSEVDITDFVLSEEEYSKSVMSYSHYLKVAFDSQHVEHVPFPEYAQLAEYATWYLRSMNPYSMLVDKPSFMQLIWRIGHDPHFHPSPAETVCVHIMLAHMKYQISVRNQEPSLMDNSHKHYTYALSFFKALLASHTLADVQALTLLSMHLRNFPKPGAAWIMCSLTVLLAIELGLHRSAKAWADTTPKMDKLEVEMRKRVFWTLHALASNLCGKLGRPMPIPMDDVDVEFPEPVNDCLPGEDAKLDNFHKCSFQVGIQTAKYTVLSSEMYRTIYSVRPTARSYEDQVKRLEAGLRQWREEIPYELSDPSRALQEDYIFAIFLTFWDMEFELTLYHPSVCRSTDPDFINANMDKCLAASSKMLHVVSEMRKLRSLDTPWINCVVYIAAIFTTLFIWFQRRDRMTSVDMTKLREDMALWLDILGECGVLLGTGDRLTNALRKIVDHSLNSINEHIIKKTAAEAVRVALPAAQEPPPSTPVYGNGATFQGQYAEASTTPTDPALSAPNPTYAAVPSGSSYSYDNGNNSTASGSVAAYQPATSAYDQQTYAGSEDMNPSHVAALASAASGTPTQRPNENYLYPNSQPANNGHRPSYSTPANGVSPNDWQQWTRTFMHQPGPSGEYLNTATTLMSLGGREGGPPGPGQDAAGPAEGAAMQGPSPANFAWPTLPFGPVPNGHVAQQ